MVKAARRAKGAADQVKDGDRIAVLEEHATVSTRDVVTGRVRIATHVDVTETMARAELRSDDVEVTRLPFGTTVVGRPPETRTEGDLTIIPVLEEVAFVEVKLVLKEEIHIRRRSTTEAVEVPVTLRRQHVDIERTDV